MVHHEGRARGHRRAALLACGLLAAVVGAGCAKAGSAADASAAAAGGAKGTTADAAGDAKTGAGGGPASGDAAASGDAPASGGASAPGDATGSGGGQGGEGGEGACTALENSGAEAAEVVGQGAFPTPAGGAVGEDVYRLVRFELFPPETPGPAVRKETIKMAPRSFEWVTVDPSGTERRVVGTWVGEQVQLHFTITCPATQPPELVNILYTATPTELRLFDTTDDNREVHVYTRD